jgi:putative transposase
MVPRSARVVAAGVPHHVTQRGNKRAIIFDGDDDRHKYLELLASNCERFQTRILGYCLMSNHVHLVLEPEFEESLSMALGRTHNDYARWLHLKRGELGHLWQNRFYSCPVERGIEWEVLRYVELNPVRAALIENAAAWPWSSAAVHLGLQPAPSWMNLQRWNQWWCGASWRIALVEGTLTGARWENIRRATLGGRPLGSERFVQDLEWATGRVLRPAKRGRKPRLAVVAGEAA